jgi:hypothetical protein
VTVNFVLKPQSSLDDIDFVVFLGENTPPNLYLLDLVNAKLHSNKIGKQLVEQGQFNLEIFGQIYNGFSSLRPGKIILFVLMPDLTEGSYASILRTYFGLQPYQDWPANILTIKKFLDMYVP